MMKEEMLDRLNRQINEELTSAYIYLDFANRFESMGLNGFAHWFSIQAIEEYGHADRIIRYLQDCDEAVHLMEIEPALLAPTTPDDLLKAALTHEQHITACIHDLYEFAWKISDSRTMVFLEWFIREQIEEEKQISDLISQLNLYGDCNTVFSLDRELALRKVPSVQMV